MDDYCEECCIFRCDAYGHPTAESPVGAEPLSDEELAEHQAVLEAMKPDGQPGGGIETALRVLATIDSLRSQLVEALRERDEFRDALLDDIEAKRAEELRGLVERYEAALNKLMAPDTWRIADGSEVGIPEGTFIRCGISAALSAPTEGTE
jgi:hypothetical protein